jgi:hypothetical protein
MKRKKQVSLPHRQAKNWADRSRSTLITLFKEKNIPKTESGSYEGNDQEILKALEELSLAKSYLKEVKAGTTSLEVSEWKSRTRDEGGESLDEEKD